MTNSRLRTNLCKFRLTSNVSVWISNLVGCSGKLTFLGALMRHCALSGGDSAVPSGSVAAMSTGNSNDEVGLVANSRLTSVVLWAKMIQSRSVCGKAEYARTIRVSVVMCGAC